MNSYPETWEQTTLEHYGEIVSGGTPDRNNPAFWNGDVLWVTPSEITANKAKFLVDTREKITKIGLSASSAKLLPENSLLVTSRATLGEVSVASKPVSTNQGFKSIVPNSKTDPNFAYHQIKTIKREMVRLASGTTFLEISKGDFSRIVVQRPQLPEQSRIAYVLDTIDEAIAKTEAVIAKLKQVRAGMLHDLLSYGLDEHGQLRDPIAHPEQFKDSPLGLIPKEWDCKPISVFCYSYAGGTPSRGMLSFFGGDIPWVKSGEVNLESISAAEETLTQAGFNASSVKWIPEGTPLIAMYGATAGQVTWLSIRATSNQAVLAIVPFSDTANSRFVFWYLRRVAPQIVKLATGSGQPNLSKAIIDRTNIALPKYVHEQEVIACRIDRIVELQNTEVHHLHKLKALKLGLQDDLLTGRVRVPETIMNPQITQITRIKEGETGS